MYYFDTEKNVMVIDQEWVKYRIKGLEKQIKDFPNGVTSISGYTSCDEMKSQLIELNKIKK